MDRIDRVSIVGMGAMGILYGDFFANALGREQVTFLADSDRARRYRNTPVYCNGRKMDFRIQDGAVPDSQGPAQLLLFAVKATALGDAISVAGNQVGKDTVILSVLNGITSEAVIGEALGMDHVLYCVSQGMDAVKLGNEILENQYYAGDSVHNQFTNDSWAAQRQKMNQKEEWIIIKNTHEALVSRKDFDEVQEKIGHIVKRVNEARKSNGNNVRDFNFFKQKIVCADCGKTMYLYGKTKGNHRRFYCGNNKLHGKCTPHSITDLEVNDYVLRGRSKGVWAFRYSNTQTVMKNILDITAGDTVIFAYNFKYGEGVKGRQLYPETEWKFTGLDILKVKKGYYCDLSDDTFEIEEWTRLPEEDKINSKRYMHYFQYLFPPADNNEKYFTSSKLPVTLRNDSSTLPGWYEFIESLRWSCSNQGAPAELSDEAMNALYCIIGDVN